VPSQAEQAHRWRLSGQVQGVGFRPFVYRLAKRHGLKGWVRNRVGDVEVMAQGQASALDAFGTALIDAAPPLAKPRLVASDSVPPASVTDFSIESSLERETAHIHVPPDYFTCHECLAELNDPADRRYRYPFINCTQCGPRYTLIARLPYDRMNTAMSGFELCETCRAEYEDPLDRRFHAEPVACPVCGPRLWFHPWEGEGPHDTSEALARCVAALREGRIVAVKGVGGYHLMCDAGNDPSVERLRAAKPRPHKPLAVMFPIRGGDGLDAVRQAARLRPEEARLLSDPVRPIVLVQRRPGAGLSAAIAPGLAEVGAMLPYSPLHHLLLADFGGPLVATSANISGEPVLTEQTDVETRLAHVAEGFLHHDRPILRPADDPVYRASAGKARPLRLGRGCAPLALKLPFTLSHPVLAVGAHMKNAIALGWQDRVVISPHIGDMGTPRSLMVFGQVVQDLQSLYGVEAQAVVCDAHPGYATTRWAEDCGLPVTRVFHHHAHAAAVAGEYPLEADRLVFTWDGVGYGEDGTLWGGEALLGRPGAWHRVGRMRPFRLPGGEKAGREPWRSAAGACWETGLAWPHCPEDTALLHQAWQKGLNAPQTTAVGRLFDVAAALTGLVARASFEGQGPMYLEAALDGPEPPVPLPLAKDQQGMWETDWQPLLRHLQDRSRSVGARSASFHASMSLALLAQARQIRDAHDIQHVGLCGGVFQNRALTEGAATLLAENGFVVHLPERIPVNDAGISFGQIIEYGATAGDRGTGNRDSDRGI